MQLTLRTCPKTSEKHTEISSFRFCSDSRSVRNQEWWENIVLGMFFVFKPNLGLQSTKF